MLLRLLLQKEYIVLTKSISDPTHLLSHVIRSSAHLLSGHQALIANQGVTHLLVNYVSIPPCQPCETLAEVPGTTEYNRTVFKDLPVPRFSRRCFVDTGSL